MRNKILLAMVLITGCFSSKEGSDSENRRDMKPSIFKSAYEGNTKEVEDYLNNGVGVNSAEDGNTALHYAAQKGHEEVIKLLLSRGANSSLFDSKRKTAYDIAANKEIRDIIRKYSLNEEGHSIIEEAVIKYNPNEEGLKKLKEIIGEGVIFNIGSRPELEIAAENDWKDVVNLLLDKGADATVGFPLAYAKSLEVAKALLDKGASVDLPDTEVLSINGEITTLLLERGVDPNKKNREGKTALMYVTEKWNEGDAVAAIEALLSEGAKLSIQDKDGNTALHHFNLNRPKIAKVVEALLKATDAEEAKRIENNKDDLANIN